MVTRTPTADDDDDDRAFWVINGGLNGATNMPSITAV